MSLWSIIVVEKYQRSQRCVITHLARFDYNSTPVKYTVNRGTLSILNMIIILLTYIWATLSIPYMIIILQTIIWITLSILNMIMILLKFIWVTLSILNMIIILQKIPNSIPLIVNRGALSILNMIIIYSNSSGEPGIFKIYWHSQYWSDMKVWSHLLDEVLIAVR